MLTAMVHIIHSILSSEGYGPSLDTGATAWGPHLGAQIPQRP